MDNVFTVREASEKARCSEDSVRKAIDSGELIANKVASEWRITESNLTAWITGEKHEDIGGENPEVRKAREARDLAQHRAEEAKSNLEADKAEQERQSIAAGFKTAVEYKAILATLENAKAEVAAGQAKNAADAEANRAKEEQLRKVYLELTARSEALDKQAEVQKKERSALDDVHKAELESTERHNALEAVAKRNYFATRQHMVRAVNGLQNTGFYNGEADLTIQYITSIDEMVADDMGGTITPDNVDKLIGLFRDGLGHLYSAIGFAMNQKKRPDVSQIMTEWHAIAGNTPLGIKPCEWWKLVRPKNVVPDDIEPDTNAK